MPAKMIAPDVWPGKMVTTVPERDVVSPCHRRPGQIQLDGHSMGTGRCERYDDRDNTGVLGQVAVVAVNDVGYDRCYIDIRGQIRITLCKVVGPGGEADVLTVGVMAGAWDAL